MISVDKAETIIKKQVRSNNTEILPLSKAYGRVLREDLKNDRDQPPFDKSTMDGIAINGKDFQLPQPTFTVLGTIAAGSRPPQRKWVKSGCYKIMTGAPVPQGCNAVIPIEYVTLQSNCAIVTGLSSIAHGLNIRWKGSDSRQGKVLVNAGEILNSTHMACAASVGKHTLKVSALPKAAIISTGNELVPVERKNILPYQTRLSNVYSIDGAIRRGPWASTHYFHFKDHPEVLLKGLKKILSSFDVVVLSGGVSKGDFDYVPETLKQLGVTCLFHGVCQKPGKPFWFGTHTSGAVVFALPGNPVSTLICGYRYLLPYLMRCSGASLSKDYVPIEMPSSIDPSITRFLPVKLFFSPANEREARIIPSGGSGDFAVLSLSDGFVEISSKHLKKMKKMLVPFYQW